MYERHIKLLKESRRELKNGDGGGYLCNAISFAARRLSVGDNWNDWYHVSGSIRRQIKSDMKIDGKYVSTYNAWLKLTHPELVVGINIRKNGNKELITAREAWLEALIVYYTNLEVNHG